jgi:hypothetical protein
MNGKTSEAFPNGETIKRLSGMSRSTIFEGMKELRTARLIASEIRSRQGKFRAYPITVYRLLPIPPAGEPDSRKPDHESRNPDGYSVHQSRNPDSMVQNGGLKNGETPHPESSPEELSGQELAMIELANNPALPAVTREQARRRLNEIQSGGH